MTGALSKIDALETPVREAAQGAVIEPIVILHPQQSTWEHQEGGDIICSVPQCEVPAGETRHLYARPYDFFRPTRLIIPSKIAPHFNVLDIKVGNRPQFNSPHPVPAIVFSEDASPIKLKLSECQVSQDICIVVQNHDSETQSFIAVFTGKDRSDEDLKRPSKRVKLTTLWSSLSELDLDEIDLDEEILND